MAKHYYISFNGVAYTEIFPSNNPIGTQQQLEGTRVWRESVDEIKLSKSKNSTVYDTLHSYFIDKTKFDVEIEIEIYSGLRATGTLYWQGLFSISDTKDNFQNTYCKLTPLRINDDYRTILEKADISYELDYNTLILEQERVGYSERISVGPVWLNGSIGTAFTTLVASGGVISTASAVAGGIYEATVAINTGLAAGDIIIVDVAELNTNTTPTFDVIAGAGISKTSEGAKGIFEGNMGFTLTGAASSPKLWLQSLPGDTTNTRFSVRKIADAYDINNAGSLLMDFIEDFITGSSFMHLTGYTGNVVSTFFDNDALETSAPTSIATFIGTYADGNYVTELATNELNNTIIGILAEWFDITSRPSFKLSFNDIMNQLREVIQVYWFIDNDDKFRLEHEKYFVRKVDNSTPIDISNHDTAEVDAKEFEYNKNKIGSEEVFQFAQAGNLDFVGRSIIYNNFETINKPIEHSPNYITTDMNYIINNLDSASNNGLGLYNCNVITGIAGADLYEIAFATGLLSSSGMSNAVYSWANLQSHYWRWSRMSENATLNAVATTMNSAIRFLQQENVRFFYSTAINPFTMITTSLTGAAPIEIKRDLETDYITLILGFDPYKL